MTRADHATGTDRVAEVAAQLGGARIIVNLQGDEPEVSGAALDRVVALLRGRPGGADGHARDPDPRRGDLSRPGVRQGRLLAARPRTLLLAQPDPLPSRRAPRSRVAVAADRHLHLGLYAYRREFLLSIAALPPPRSRPPRSSSSSASSTPAIPIAVGIVDEPSVGIDTPEDYRRFVERWRAGRTSVSRLTPPESPGGDRADALELRPARDVK